MSDRDKETLEWIGQNKTLPDLSVAIDQECWEKLYYDHPDFLIWLWGEEWYLATQTKEKKWKKSPPLS